MLIVITAISLVVSITMSAIAWRLAREERRRSRARVAVLASDLDLDLRPATAGAGFIVTVPHAGEVGRYRVSFRSDDRIVPHVDHRDHEPIAQLQ